MSTTIQISDNLKKTLDRMKMFRRETYNDVIENLVEDFIELNEKTKKELEERRKNPEFISHKEVGKILGL